MILTFRKAVKEDACMLIIIYNSAFYDDYIHYGECPGYGRTKENMEVSIINSPKYIIFCDAIPVGVISFENRGNGDYYLGCLCIIPEYQGKGIGTKAFQYIMNVCSDWKRITLVTPSDKTQNIKFYTEKCGCNVKEKIMDGNVEVVKLCRER